MTATNVNPASVAIVGAGLAGLTCAQTLAHAGYVVHLFDKSRGPSGRMSTRRANDSEAYWQCDHGAQYFTARDADFRAEVRQWQQAGAAALWPAAIASYDERGFSPLASATERFVGIPRMTAPAQHLVTTLQCLPTPVRFQWQSTVQGLHKGEAGWSLSFAEHAESPTYRAVLLAVPAPQAAPLLDPVAVEAAALTRGAQMRACWALMVRCQTPPTFPCDASFINTGPLQWIARDTSKPGRSGLETWLLHASPAWSEAHIEDDPATVAQALLQAFAALGGPDPASVEASAHRWRYADTVTPSRRGCWWDPAAGLGVCGDWLQGGKVEGAWQSGRGLANRVLQSLSVAGAAEV